MRTNRQRTFKKFKYNVSNPYTSDYSQNTSTLKGMNPQDYRNINEMPYNQNTDELSTNNRRYRPGEAYQLFKSFKKNESLVYLIAKAEKFYQENPPNLEITDQLNVFKSTENFLICCFQQKPYYKSKKFPICYKPKNSTENYQKGWEHEFEIHIKGQLVGKGKSIDKSLITDLAALNTLDRLCPDLAAEIRQKTNIVNISDSMDFEYPIKDDSDFLVNKAVDPNDKESFETVGNSSLKSNNKSNINNRNRKGKQNIIFQNSKNFNEFLVQCKNVCIKSDFFKKNLHKSIIEIFTEFSKNFLKISIKIFYKIQNGKDEISKFFILRNNLKILKNVLIFGKDDIPFVSEGKEEDNKERTKNDLIFRESEKSMETFALMAVNFDRFTDLLTENLKEELEKEELSFICLGKGTSKANARNNAIFKFLDYIIPEIISSNKKNVFSDKVLSDFVKFQESKKSEKVKHLYENGALEMKNNNSNNFNNKSRNGNNFQNNEMHNFEKIRTDEEYMNLTVTDPRITFFGDSFKSNKILHKNPKALIQEIISKKYKIQFSEMFEINKRIAHQKENVYELVYETITIRESARSFKIAENLTIQRLLKLMYPTYKYYYDILKFVINNKGEKIPDPTIKNSKVDEIQELRKKVRINSSKINEFEEKNFNARYLKKLSSWKKDMLG